MKSFFYLLISTGSYAIKVGKGGKGNDMADATDDATRQTGERGYNIYELNICEGSFLDYKINIKFDKRPTYMAKDTCVYGKRDLRIWQKSPTYMAKETYQHCIPDLRSPLPLSAAHTSCFSLVSLVV